MNQLLRPTEVAKRLNVSRRKAYYLISSGELPSVSIGQKSVRVSESDLQDFIDNNKSSRASDVRTS